MKKPVKIEGFRRSCHNCPTHGVPLVKTEVWQIDQFKTKRYCPGKLNAVNDEDGPHEVPDDMEYGAKEQIVQSQREDIFQIDTEIIE